MPEANRTSQTSRSELRLCSRDDIPATAATMILAAINASSQCETYRLREGANCDYKVAFGQPKFCSTHSRIERQVLEDSAGADLIPDPPGTHHPCDSLSLEELRRTDADVSSDKPPR
jgi:hypothetical protein